MSTNPNVYPKLTQESDAPLLNKTSDFKFDLPAELIAQYPLPNRSDSRLLVYSRANDSIKHTQFNTLPEFFQPGDLVVMNDSRVIPARLFGHKSSGGKVELLVERMLENNCFLAHIRASKSPKNNSQIIVGNDCIINVLNRVDDLFLCQTTLTLDTVLHQHGHMPLPPYITRHDDTSDLNRYQTVYARHKGSVAAPTAGLHFDETVLANLKARGVNIAYVTLHVGAGTFQPVRSGNIEDHVMHSEQCHVSQALCDQVNSTHQKGGRVIAIGTTTLRSLESAAHGRELRPFTGDTDIFIRPGYQFKICDGLMTNFHLPESTLLMLVAAFIGYHEAMSLYQTAINEGYRFFSYGDTSLLM